jgi:hypothetical protein
MGKADRISGAFWLVFGLFISIESYRLGLGTLHKPGPGPGRRIFSGERL